MTGRNDDGVEVSSPACSMHLVDDAYMGYAGREEVLGLLNEMLEAERAGARVTLETAQAVGDGPLADLMRAVHRDEAHWCAVLSRAVKALDGVPSPATGAFYGKAMAVADPIQRVAFLNRGQGWVVRRLAEMLPRLRDDGLHAELSAMLRSHEDNIAKAEELSPRQP